MTFLAAILPYIQITLSILLIITILLQQSGSSLGGAFGGGDDDSTFHTRRGAEKFLFNSAIILSVLFALSAFAALVI